MYALLAMVLLACTPPEDRPDDVSISTPTGSTTTIPTAPTTPAKVLEFAEIEIPDRAHQRSFTYTLDTEAEALLQCVVPSEPDERHVHHFDADVQGEWTFYGLLARTEHVCTLAVGGDQAQVSFTTGDPLPTLLPWTTSGDPQAVWGGYTMVNQFWIGGFDQIVTVFDSQGRVRWTHAMDTGTSTGLETRYTGDGLFLIGGATDHPPSMVDLDGNTIWQVPTNPEGYRYHHDTILTPHGTMLMLRDQDMFDGNNSFTGFAIEEWDIPPTSLQWSYSAQTAVDAGELPTGDGDVFHANALLWVDDSFGPGVIVSLAHLDQLARIDYGTRDILWTLGEGGTIDPGTDGRFYGQHAPELVGNSLLLHDNGRFRPDGNWSRVLELDFDQVARTATVVTDWRETGWYQKLWGDADRLPDGTILVSRGHCSTCGVPDQRTKISVIDPALPTPTWELWIDHADVGAYRAHQIDGCTLFENERYCAN